MREFGRIRRILSLLGDTWEETPDQRFFQFMINQGLIPDSMTHWRFEDDELEELLYECIRGDEECSQE